MVRSYIRLLAFTLGLLVGVQLPGFVDQYAKRVDAHYLEAKTNFAGFQQTADRHFNGDVEAMLRHHEQSDDVVFQEDAQTIRRLWLRLQVLNTEQLAMSQPFARRAWHTLFAANPELMAETRLNYSYTVPLTPDAIAAGLCGALSLALLVELTLVGLAGMLRSALRRS